MSYVKRDQPWASNELVTAEKMNNIEDGVEQAIKSYSLDNNSNKSNYIVSFPAVSIPKITTKNNFENGDTLKNSFNHGTATTEDNPRRMGLYLQDSNSNTFGQLAASISPTITSIGLETSISYTDDTDNNTDKLDRLRFAINYDRSKGIKDNAGVSYSIAAPERFLAALNVDKSLNWSDIIENEEDSSVHGRQFGYASKDGATFSGMQAFVYGPNFSTTSRQKASDVAIYATGRNGTTSTSTSTTISIRLLAWPNGNVEYKLSHPKKFVDAIVSDSNAVATLKSALGITS